MSTTITRPPAAGTAIERTKAITKKVNAHNRRTNKLLKLYASGTASDEELQELQRLRSENQNLIQELLHSIDDLTNSRE